MTMENQPVERLGNGHQLKLMEWSAAFTDSEVGL
jgi:hypothetical protein